ncbi:MAG: tRNA lysidine(34) synthetase TilS, partial [Bacteroidota bacterium]|nr:tRNA lysidine(34) synthetase TilS [Bacteroidota bacterium]
REFQNFIDKNQLFDRKQKILLTVSGGIDSISMLHLFHKVGIDIGVAHCNFMLRGEESDEDEIFVRNMAAMLAVPFYVIRFNTWEYARQEGISIEMAARDLRYKWFEEIRVQYKYDYIATAHNLNDVVETFFLNIVRGTGIKGLTGIKPKSNHLIRPMLFASRRQIEAYCLEHDLHFREDSSNASVKFSRNKIRHLILPVLEKINPNFLQTAVENIQRLSETEQIYFSKVGEVKKQVCFEKEGSFYIDLNKMKEIEPQSSYLYEFLVPFNFSRDNVAEIVEAMDGIPGKQFFSSTHRLLKDRNYLIITGIKKQADLKYYIDEGMTLINGPVKLKLRVIKKEEGFKLPLNSQIACLDYDRITFPLILRHWQKGDYFRPLGMKDIKKLSDYFIDSKLSLIEKEQAWLLTSENKIVWIVGRRLDDRYKITDRTQNILVIEPCQD